MLHITVDYANAAQFCVILIGLGRLLSKRSFKYEYKFQLNS